MNPVTFVYNNDASNSEHLGFIAEEVYKLDPRLVDLDPNGDGLPFTVKYGQYTAVLTKAIQELYAEMQPDVVGRSLLGVSLPEASSTDSRAFSAMRVCSVPFSRPYSRSIGLVPSLRIMKRSSQT